MAVESVKISELPIDIQNKIPYSIKTYKDEYNIYDLPPKIQTLIYEYLEYKRTVKYKQSIFDISPDISNYGDLTPIDNVENLVIEYFKSYISITPGEFPWDPYFGSYLKTYIQRKDTTSTQILINNEAENIAKVISRDLSLPVYIEDINVTRLSPLDVGAEYNMVIILNINNKKKKFDISIFS